MEASTTKKSSGLDWILFLVSTLVLILMLIYADEWFWLALPFSLTYLVKALNAM
ncbi:MAG TPA: hypothetical protein PKA00_11710 [Saprospiraceae bacterium]|nr:hypothetical protein [Saprospiraceae bacterium]HMQ83570.1 hypothetical protein [Saprospiraceae bacterium]